MIWWNSWSDFIAMGGYGLYVWGSFGVTAAVIAGEIWTIGARRRALTQENLLQREVDFGEPT
jgi:heme exporter protein D